MFANLQGALLFGKITVTIGDDQTHVARCRLGRRGKKYTSFKIPWLSVYQARLC